MGKEVGCGITVSSLYVLYQLKRAGVSQSDLLRVYLSVIRPVVEICLPSVAH